jgi:tetratricopeptide (TPR) repeat protein
MAVCAPVRRSAVLLGTLLALGLGQASPARAAPATPEADLARAIALFQNLDAALNKLLDRQPASQIAAKARIYLGLIALNALRTDDARSQFEQALAIDPTVELPRRVSPKTKTVFGQARRKVASDAQSQALAPAAPAPSAPLAPATPQALVVPVPTQGPAAAPEVTAPVEESHSHWPTWTLAGAAAVAAAFAIYGGVVVLNYNSEASSAAQNPSLTQPQLVSAQSNASAWRVGGIVAAGVGAACAAGAVLTW